MPNKKNNPQVEVTQVRSLIGRPKKQEAIIRSLGLGRIGRKIVHTDTPDVRGMINKVSHLVNVKEIVSVKSGGK